ncbi:MAG: HD domain-containing protein [Clostridia bacterium]|nr:HD domain-containing protein [Clostridia bacterium]
MCEYPTRDKAERLLTEAESLNPGLWVAHSRNVAKCAEVIASHCNLNPEKAYILGLLHDVGRRAGIGQLKHVYYGWKHMNELGYPTVAKVCLTHSYNTHRFEDDMAKIDVSPEQADEAKAALAGYEYDDYDRLIQLCDSIATAEGVVDVTERMADVRTRYGSYPQPKWDKNIELLEYFAEKTGSDIYELCRPCIPMQEEKK